MIYINFDAATDRAGLKGLFGCDLLLAQESAAKLSGNADPARCTFVNSSILAAFLGSGATIQMDEKIYVAPRVSRGLHRQIRCSFATPPVGSPTSICFFTSQKTGNGVRVDRPNNPVSPVAVLKGPSVLGPCDDLTLDASSSYGSAGRQMQFYFGLMPGSPNDAVLRELIFKVSRQPYHTNKITLPSKAMVPGANYSFMVSRSCTLNTFCYAYLPSFVQLRISNFLDVEDETVLVVAKSFNSSPIVQIQGPSVRQVFSSRSFKLRGDVGLSNCSGSEDPTLDLQWSIVNVVPSLPALPAVDSQTEYTRALYVPAGALMPGYAYMFQLLATSAIDPTETGVDTVVVQCAFSPLIASIDGGSRTVSAQDQISLDASKSYDLDNSASASQYPLMYSWACETGARSRCFMDTEGLLLRSTSSIVLKAGTLVPGAYTFTVNVTKEPGPRLATTSVDIWVYPARVPSVGIRPLSFPVVNPGDRLVLEGQYPGSRTDSFATVWTQTDGEDILDYPKLVSTQLTLPSLSIRTGVLTAGQTYGFRFTVLEAGSVGFAEISFTVNAPPTSGSFSVSPTVGHGVVDIFTLQCLNWADSAEDMPITYEFRYTENTTDEIPLGTPDANVYQVTFPEPPGSNEQGIVTVIAYVTDQWGGQQRVTQPALILAPAKASVRGLRSSTNRSEDSLSALEHCRATGDIDCIVRLTVQLARSLASTLTCSERGRMLSTLTESADQSQMNKAEVAAFSQATKALSALSCIDDGGVRRQMSSSDLGSSLALASTLTSNSMGAGLDPVATKGIGGSLSSALAAIADKNSARRTLSALLRCRGARPCPPRPADGLPAFARRSRPVDGLYRPGIIRAGAGGGELSSPLLDAIAGLSSSQVNGAVAGEDPAGLETDNIRMSSRLVRPGALQGTLAPPAADGSPVPAFALPKANFSGGGPSLSVQVTGAARARASSRRGQSTRVGSRAVRP
jgi:hypothetical protein